MIIALLLAASVVPAGQSFNCTPAAVYDGDGPIWCAEGPHIRLSGIAAREMVGTCRPGHPCPVADPRASRDQLVALAGKRTGTRPTGHITVLGPTMRCRSAGGAGGNRTRSDEHTSELQSLIRRSYAVFCLTQTRQ